VIGTLPEIHSTVLERVIAVLEADDRFEALLGGGSMIHGGFDEQSDLDLILVARSVVDHSSVMAERREIAARAGTLLAAFTGEHVGEPRLLICLFGPPLIHVDLKFVIATNEEVLVERPRILWSRSPELTAARLEAAQIRWPNRHAQWFEDRAWIWLHYGATKLLRGELFEAIGMLAFFRDQVLGPMLHRRAGRSQRGVRRIELDADAAMRLAGTSAGFDASQVAHAFEHAIALYLDLRQDEHPETMTSHMPDALLDYMRLSPVCA
jgi:hypothetical protein